MTDAEWQRWQQTFSRKEGVMPQIEKKLRRAQLGVVIAHLIVFGIALFEIGFGVMAIVRGPTTLQRLIGAWLIALMAVMGTLFITIMRRLYAGAGQTPDAWLSWMERRLEVSVRTGQLVRWGGVVACAVTTGFCLWAERQAPGDLADHAITAAVILFTLAMTWFMPVLVRRKVSKQRAQIRAWREALAE
jgi:hypothetical protein